MVHMYLWNRSARNNRLCNRAAQLQAARKNRAGRVWSHPQLLSALGGPGETVAPQTFQEGTNYRLASREEITSGVQLLHRPNSSRSCSQPRKHHLLSGHRGVVLLILYLLLCVKPVYLCRNRTVELWRGKAWRWRRGLGNR